ncbi:triggering receptor expressed on myeloid cells 1 [Monodelphis domestica]|uniref:Triggering receptor expressed on myeloid cells 1-like n=1 Tax=Monodelphis domestica TaxID=13616 RepID=F7G1L0_MONDO|nr:triggering receptor expressed on myeloid cells 1 [Monodelphis domestica]
MEVAGGWRSQMLLLLFLCFAALQEPLEEKEECIVEGQNITFGCGYNFGKYFRAIKAWQRLGASGPFETLAQTMNNNGEPSFIQVGRYLLEDDPPNSMLKVTILELQREDAGLYQCVIYRPPQVVDILYRPIRLKTCNGVSKIPTITPTPQGLTFRREKTSIPFTTEAYSPTNPKFHTQAPVKSTTDSLSTTLRAKDKDIIFPVYRLSHVLAVTLGIFLNKSLVFITLYILLRKKTGC